jgi:hypothetical protein
MPRQFFFTTLLLGFLVSSLFRLSDVKAQAYATEESEHAHGAESSLDDGAGAPFIQAFSCLPASSRNIAPIDEGNSKVERFLMACSNFTGGSKWCPQLTRPNPASQSTFSCTYGAQQPHLLINPDESTWTYAFRAVQLVDELEGMGIKVAQIYNWWRPQPYNTNVGGAAGRHPYGTSVDVRMATMNDMERAHAQLCKWREKGRLRAVGYYGSTGLHFGIGDKIANTWGKNCTSKN